MQKKAKSTKYLRSPVVAIMGHVDHGKTSLLSAIRKIDLVSKEHGGITQCIGAYQVEYKQEKLTFIDTPGHAAFAKMRSYGAMMTDLVVLVISGVEGVKPQTKESLAHIKQAKVPFMIAISKMDLPEASVEKVKSQLAENNVLVEGYGGDIVCQEVSAKQKKGINELLEMILLLTKMKGLEANPKAEFKGVIIDSRLDPQKGPLATILVKDGTLKIGDKIFSKDLVGKVKLMLDENGNPVYKAEPAKPVLVLGFKKLPAIGAQVGSKLVIEKTVVKEPKLNKPEEKKEIEEEAEEKEEEEKIKIILKADSKGTLEAIQANLPSEVEIILGEVGQVSDSDVLLALSTQAQVIGFNVKTPTLVKKLASTEKVNIKTYNIIYELLEDLEKKVLKILEPTIDEEVLGEAEVIAEFKIKSQHIAGCRIKKGKINKNDRLHIKKEDKIIADARIRSFQKEKQEILEAKAGDEVGIVFNREVDFEIGDAIISYSQK